MKQSMFIKIYIIPSLLLSPLFSMSSNSWFSIWMTLEFNLMTFIPIMIFFNKYYKELSLKYFIIQAISSSLLIFSSNSNFIQLNQNMLMNLFIMMINISLYIKMGAAPFHLWFINIMKNSSWIICLILSTWQKIIPMMSLMYLFNKFLTYSIILISSISSTFFGLNHQSIRLIMSYSSINHISWMLFNMMVSEMMWMLYFISYMIINISLMMTFFKFKIFYINQIFLINLNNSKLYLLLNFFSISGLPPMFGFSMKWISIYFMTWNYSPLIPIIMSIMSSLTFIFYTRICISLMLNFNIKNKLTLINKFLNNNKMSILLIIPMSFIFNLWILSIWMF